MHPARVAELLQPFLGPADGKRPNLEVLYVCISTYIDILQRWNARINLTAIRDPEDIVPRHFGESLFAARHLFPLGFSPETNREGHGFSRALTLPEKKWALAPEVSTNDRPTVADVGSGAGFPGLPLKLWAPPISLTLIESNHKKATFLREVARALTLTDVNIQNTRAETLIGATFDVVTLRAVEHFEAILPTAATLVAPGGRLALLIGSAQLEAARTAQPHLSWSEPVPVPLSRSRLLAIAHRPR